MREIIYRCWDKKSKKYRNVNSIVFNGNSTIYGDNLPNVVNSWGKSIIEHKDILIHREQGEYELEAYTGLKDKNGNKVFEGDIVKTHHAYDDIPLIYEVCFGKYEQDGSADEYTRTNCLGFYIKFISLEPPEWDLEYEIADYLKQFSIIDSEFGEMEIIGNIHDKE